MASKTTNTAEQEGKTTIFVGGSRGVSHLPSAFAARLDNIVRQGFRVIVGDAHGADATIQLHLLGLAFRNVTVFCSGRSCRNNLGTWTTRHVDVPASATGFPFYAAKDCEMAREADFGLMIWDGKSPGTLLNMLRLNMAGRKAVLFLAFDGKALTLTTIHDCSAFIAGCDPKVVHSLRQRATPEEWAWLEAG